MADDGLVTALLDPAAYPHAVERAELIETHISWVFLAGERVYRVKKPVDLGFLDFTTPERRPFFCEEEVRLNRRLTHGVYLGVVELAAEVAVAMRRLPQERIRIADRAVGPPCAARAIPSSFAWVWIDDRHG